MVTRILTTAAVLVVLAAPALAGDFDLNRCGNTPLGQMTRDHVQMCQDAETLRKATAELVRLMPHCNTSAKLTREQAEKCAALAEIGVLKEQAR